MRPFVKRRYAPLPRHTSSSSSASSSLHHPTTTPVQQLLVIISLLSTMVLVVFFLPTASDSRERTMMLIQQKIQEEPSTAVKGIVVSHGFLKIAVEVADPNREALLTKSGQTAPSEPARTAPVHSNTQYVSKNQELPEIRHQEPPAPKQNAPKREQPKPDDHTEQMDNGEQRQRMGGADTPRIQNSNQSTVPDGKPKLVPKPREHIAIPLAQSTDKDEIVVDVILHRILSPMDDSLLTCRLSEEDLISALKDAADIWRKQAKIILRYGSPPAAWERVSEDTELSFQEHLQRFPKNDVSGQPWTTENPGRIGLVGNDLIQMLSVDSVDRWTAVNVINVYCIGAFVGYNGVTWSRHVFIRSIQYHKTDKPMDVHTFTRILAHEIGHVLSLGHPGRDFCSPPCEQSTCNLMCQQRSLPSGVDPRFARALTQIQTSHARTSAALIDTFNTARFDRSYRVLGLSSQTIPNTRSARGQLVFLSHPLTNATFVRKVNVLINRLKPTCILGLVTGRLNGDIMTVKMRALGSFNNGLMPKDGVARLVFDNLEGSWWTSSRHIEAELQPPLPFNAGQYIGFALSTSYVSFQQQKRQGLESLLVSKIPTGFFTASKQQGAVELKVERVVGYAPIVSLLIAYGADK